MKRAFWPLLLAQTLFAQDARVERGAKLFAANCSVPYCHGPNGSPGRAPKLVGHSFAQRDLTDIVSNGIANKGMPRFSEQLSPQDLEAIVSYVMSLRGSAAEPRRAAAPVRPLAPEPPGKALFFDATRLGGCGRCHELENRGSPVAETIRNIPSDLRAASSTHTVTVSPPGEAPFAGIVLEQSEKSARIYDLSSNLPVLRTFARGRVEITKGSTWSHSDALAAYSDTELYAIVEYLQSTIRR